MKLCKYLQTLSRHNPSVNTRLFHTRVNRCQKTTLSSSARNDYPGFISRLPDVMFWCAVIKVSVFDSWCKRHITGSIMQTEQELFSPSGPCIASEIGLVPKSVAFVSVISFVPFSLAVYMNILNSFSTSLPFWHQLTLDFISLFIY